MSFSIDDCYLVGINRTTVAYYDVNKLKIKLDNEAY